MATIDWSQVIDYAAVALFGLLVGAGELVARYRDAPERALRTPPAFLYVGVNVAAAVAALATIRVFGWTFGGDTPGQIRLMQALTAGFASMALFRSSLFNVRIGDADVPIGPSSFLKVVLVAADRGVDRGRAQARVDEVMGAMAGVSFQKAYAGLPVLCFELMQNVPEEDQRAVGEEVNKLVAAPMDESIKGAVLGLKLMNVVGATVLLKAVESLAPRIRAAARVELPTLPRLQSGERERIAARVVDAKGGEISATITWESTDSAVATVDASGLIRAVAPGRTSVTATVDGVTGETDVEVIAPLPVYPAIAAPIPPGVGVNDG